MRSAPARALRVRGEGVQIEPMLSLDAAEHEEDRALVRMNLLERRVSHGTKPVLI
jgi:hypothetical protein